MHWCGACGAGIPASQVRHYSVLDGVGVRPYHLVEVGTPKTGVNVEHHMLEVKLHNT